MASSPAAPGSKVGKGLIASAKAAGGAAGSGTMAALALKSTGSHQTTASAASSSSGAASSDKKPARLAKLHKPEIYVRIRPLATEGGHAEDGTVLTKHLESWDATSVTIETQYLFSKGEAKYAYPTRVFGTEASQQEVTDAMVPDLVNSFTTDRTSVLFFAYGQTGTGKTRTMLGTEPSLLSAEPHDDWGVFPRVCAATFEKVASFRQQGLRCVLSGSAIEFYMGECFDLLLSSREGNAPVQVDMLTRMPSGETCVVLEQQSDLLGFIAKVIANRTSRSTNFNKASSVHSGSSRSHAALILTLSTLDEKSREYSKTHFTLVDLAGAERPDKVRDEVKGGTPGFAPEFITSMVAEKEAGRMTQKDIEKQLPINFQTRLINFELFSLGNEVLKASECHRKGKPFKLNPFATPTIKFLSAILDGRARLAMCVTLSPAGRNAWETWFSLQYGADLSRLHAPRYPDQPKNIDKLHSALSKEAEKIQKELDGMAKNHRYYGVKLHKAKQARESVRRLELLMQGQGGGASS